MDFHVTLREGIVGGFAGPVMKQAIDITGGESGASITHILLEPESKTDYNTLSGGAPVEALSGFFDLLKQRLQELPTEDPVGSEDIYGLDTSLSFYSEDFEWSNGGSDGCSQGESNVQASPEQKEKFKELVDVVKSFSQQYVK